MCDEAAGIEQRSLAFVSDHLQMQVMCAAAAREDLYMLVYVPDHLKMQ